VRRTPDFSLQKVRSLGNLRLLLRDLWEVIELDATTGIASHVTLHKKDAEAQALILVNIEESYQTG
jgi:hypothetical protein